MGSEPTQRRPNGFPPEKRLRRSTDYARVFALGRVWWHPLVSVRVLQNQLGRTRIGFTASKRLGKAVVRNLIRRRFREVVRRLAFRSGVDIVVSGRPPVVQSSYQEIEEALLTVFRRARVLERKSE